MVVPDSNWFFFPDPKWFKAPDPNTAYQSPIFPTSKRQSSGSKHLLGQLLYYPATRLFPNASLSIVANVNCEYQGSFSRTSVICPVDRRLKVRFSRRMQVPRGSIIIPHALHETINRLDRASTMSSLMKEGSISIASIPRRRT